MLLLELVDVACSKILRFVINRSHERERAPGREGGGERREREIRKLPKLELDALGTAFAPRLERLTIDPDGLGKRTWELPSPSFSPNLDPNFPTSVYAEERSVYA